MGVCIGCHTIPESTVATVEHFGKFDRILQPGLHCVCCCFDTVSNYRSLKLLSRNFSIETITKESLSVTITVGVQYRIDADHRMAQDENIPLESMTSNRSTYGSIAPRSGQYDAGGQSMLYKAIYSIRDPELQLEQHINNYFRSVCSHFQLRELLKEKDKFSNELEEKLNQEMNKFGYIVYRALVSDIDPPQKVKESMNTVLTSQNRRDAAINDAEAEKQTAILKAEGLAKVRELEGVGQALQRKALSLGLRETLTEFGGQDLTQHAMTSMLMMAQHMDMIKEVASSGKCTFIMSSNPMGANIMEEQLQTALLATKHVL